MVKATINGKEICVEEGTTIKDAAEAAGFKIPSLCYLKDINEIGACRVCVVEVEGKQSLVASCNNVIEEGMSILTDSPKVQQVRETNVKLILSEHEYHCATCVRNTNCALQSLAADLNIIDAPYERSVERQEWNQEFPLIRDSAKCIKCMRCIQVCDKIQDMHVWDILNTGRNTSVGVKGNQKIENVDCALCGQCITHCPTGALRARDDTRKVRNAIIDPEKIVVVQIAPAVRSAWGENLGIPEYEATVGRMVAAVRALGVDYVFDTDFSADLTIMEEGHELLERLQHANEEGTKLPLFTSCCPGWVRFMKTQYPEYVDHLSTAKSPQQMFGAVTKSYYADILQVDPSKIFCVSIMPCTAKKYECDVPEVNDAEAGKDVDVVLTTRELGRMIRMAQINVEALEDEPFDEPLGVATGAGVIFGATGGVMEAALRSAYYFVTGHNPGADDFKIVRGEDGIRRVTVSIEGTPVRAAVASGLGNARKLMEQIKAGKADYDFVEVMACPGGCAGGGGQPIHDGEEHAYDRGAKLYQLDRESEIRFSHENPSVIAAYENYFEEPLSHKSHELLHTCQKDWTL